MADAHRHPSKLAPRTDVLVSPKRRSPPSGSPERAHRNFVSTVVRLGALLHTLRPPARRILIATVQFPLAGHTISRRARNPLRC